MVGLPREHMSWTDTSPYLWYQEIFRRLRCSFKITLEFLNPALDIYYLNIYLCNILKIYGLPKKTCQEQTHLLTCDPMTFVKHVYAVLYYPVTP